VIYAPDTGGAHFGDVALDLNIRLVKTAPKPVRPNGFFGWIIGKIREESYEVSLAKLIADSMEDNFDVVNVHDIAYRTGYFYKRRGVATRVVWQENVPLFLYVSRGRFFHDLVGRAYWLLKRFTDRKYFLAIDAISVLDDLTKHSREARGGRNVHIIRAGIDFKKFYAPVKDFKEKASQKEIHILAVGALNPVRRFDNVIEAVSYLREWGYRAHARIVAHNTWHQDQCRNDLLSLVSTLRLESYIDFHFNGMPEAELVKAFQSADVFVQAVYAPPPSHQGWGLVNFEAMAAGLPVIVVRSSTATEVLREGETALFFDPLQPKQIAEKLKFLIDNPDEYARIAEGGQLYVRENQSWKKYAMEMLKLFEKTPRGRWS
jgi:glycosyltransferase involved in cell wall biosynthesis